MQPEKTAGFAVGQYGGFLATRTAGRDTRNSLDEVLRASPGAVIVISFAGVEAMTFGFADEFLGCFFSCLVFSYPRPAGVLIDGLNSENAETAAICLERRDLIAAAVVTPGAQPALIGGADFLAASFAQAAALGTFTAAEFAGALKITAQNANNRLRRLTEAGAIWRDQARPHRRGGREYIYQCVAAPGVA